jgi:integrase
MRQPIKLIIKKGKSRRDGTSIIFLQYCFSQTRRTLISTDIAIPAEYWNKNTGSILSTLPTAYGNVEALEASLREKLRRAEQMVDYAIHYVNLDPIRILRKYFKQDGEKLLYKVDLNVNSQDVYYQIDLYLRSKVGLVQEATLTTIRAMKKHLLAFQDFEKLKITFESFDPSFYQKFVRFLLYDAPLMRRNRLDKGLRINTVGKTIKHLKTFLKDRIANKIIPYIDLTAFKYMEEDVDAVYLDWNELSSIYKLDLTAKPNLIKYRDLFVLACLTGFRFSDLSKLQKGNLRNGMLHVTQKKTSSNVIVPLSEDAHAILVERYGMNIPKVSMVNFNYYVKDVVRLAGIIQPVHITHKKGSKIIEESRPKFAWISSHTARRSFCTNEFLAGTPTDLIMTISGHKSEKAFRRYIKADQMQKAFMIKKIWESRPNL